MDNIVASEVEAIRLCMRSNKGNAKLHLYSFELA